MPDQNPPTVPPAPDVWVQRITAFFDGSIRVLPILRDSIVQIVTAASAIGAVFYSYQSHTASSSNAAKLDAVTAKVDESAKLMTSRPIATGAKPQ